MLLGRQEGSILEVSGLEKVDNRICMVLEWTLGLPTPGSIFSAAVSQTHFTSQGNMGDSEPPGILCESCCCIIHRAACPLL